MKGFSWKGARRVLDELEIRMFSSDYLMKTLHPYPIFQVRLLHFFTFQKSPLNTVIFLIITK